MLLVKDLQKRAVGPPLDLTALEAATHEFKQTLLDLFGKLSKMHSWGNGRDVKSLAQSMFGELVANAVQPITRLTLTEEAIVQALQAMVEERSRQNKAFQKTQNSGDNKVPPLLNQHSKAPDPPQTSLSTGSTKSQISTQGSTPAPPSTNDKDKPPKSQDEDSPAKDGETDELAAILGLLNVQRDPGVSDEVWGQLERDKHAAVAREREYLRMQQEKHEQNLKLEELRRAELAAMVNEERLKIEQKRVQAELDRRNKEEELAA